MEQLDDIGVWSNREVWAGDTDSKTVSAEVVIKVVKLHEGIKGAGKEAEQGWSPGAQRR